MLVSFSNQQIIRLFFLCVVERVWVPVGLWKKRQGTLRVILAFAAAEVSASQRLSALPSPRTFLFSPIYTFSKLISTSPKHSNFQRDNTKCKFSIKDYYSVLGFFPTKFYTGFVPLGNTQTYSHVKQKVLKTTASCCLCQRRRVVWHIVSAC